LEQCPFPFVFNSLLIVLIPIMKAAIIEAKGARLRVEDVELADPGPGEVRVRVEACGICRSDLHAIDGGEDVAFPAVLGHEAAGVIDACGPQVDGLTEGDRVVLSWTPACGTCPSCTRSKPQLCARIAMSVGSDGPLSWKGRGLDRFMGLGAFSQQVVVPENMAVAIVGEIPPEQACLIGCAVMTGFGAATKTAAIRSGEAVAVIGCGGVGLAAVQGARVAGADRIVAIDPLAERRQAALAVGATEAIQSPGAVASVVALSAGGVDAAIECVGRVETMREALEMVRPGGRAVVVGLADFGDRLEIEPLQLLFEKSIKGSMYGSADPQSDFQALVSLAEQGRLDLGSLVAKTRPLAEINEGIAETRDGMKGRVVITF